MDALRPGKPRVSPTSPEVHRPWPTTRWTAPRRSRASTSAVLDEKHVGDIRGALGTIRLQDTGGRRGWGARLLTLAAIVGPGIIVMVGDNDAGGVATYSQAGQNYGTSLLWVLPLLIPVLIVNQEMVVRLGAVTGVGHARLIKERFGRFWGLFSVGNLLVLDFLTIVTEFIGVDLALGYFGVSKYISVPARRLGSGRDHGLGQLPALGTFHAPLRRGELPGHPAGRFQPSTGRPGAARFVRARDLRRRQLDVGAAHHRHRGHDCGPVATVLPAVQHRRQEDHPPLHQLRAGRYRARAPS